MKIETPSQLVPRAQRHSANFGNDAAGHIQERVANIATDAAQVSRFLAVQRAGFIAGGRLNGSENKTRTLVSCFAQPIGDSLFGKDSNGVIGIMDALRRSVETMRRGGGVGYDFSPLRPVGAAVKGTSTRAGGPVSYMGVFDRMSETVGATGGQMAILRIDHPDIEQFIDAKRSPDFAAMGLGARDVTTLAEVIGRNGGFGGAARMKLAAVSNFNLSVAVTDEFMQAVADNGTFALVHEAAPGGGPGTTKLCADGKVRYVYRTIKAAALWDKIMDSAYKTAEPSVVFVDRLNDGNNLWYCEQLSACSPDARQFLPAYGAECMGRVALESFVLNPLTPDAVFDWAGFAGVVQSGVALLDRVLDVTAWPLAEQEVEAQSKRRIGLGYVGLAAAVAKLGIHDGPDAMVFARQVGEAMRDHAYRASVHLARRLGAFPLFNADRYLQTGTFASGLPADIQAAIREHGVRNSHLLSHAQEMTSIEYMPLVEAAAPFIDGACSKAVCVPAGYPFDQFTQLYSRAWIGGSKGIAAYRQTRNLGSVLDDAAAANDDRRVASDTREFA